MRYFTLLLMVLAASPVLGDMATNGPDGIDATATGLNGDDVLIGQAELGRSAKAGYDSPNKSASGTIPVGVYFRNSGGQDTPDSANRTNHATLAAGIMIGTQGVATSADLHSAALGGGADDVDIALTLNRLATLSSGNVRAINLSFGRGLGFFESPDGSSHLTSFVDWSARQHDVLYVASWANEDDETPSTPTDNLNGITVGASQQQMGGGGSWRYFAATNSLDGLDFDDTQNIQILAPGHNIIALGYDEDNMVGSVPFNVAGTSFAAPSVTGAAALLHQYSNQNFGTSNSRRHEVMKAVMMNSADKISGVQGSNRTVCDSLTGPCMDWEDSEAYLSPSIPLDDKMGAGALNVRRAVQQYAPGEQNPGNVESVASLPGV